MGRFLDVKENIPFYSQQSDGDAFSFLDEKTRTLRMRGQWSFKSSLKRWNIPVKFLGRRFIQRKSGRS